MKNYRKFALFFAAFLGLLILAPIARTQDGSQLRTVHGSVIDAKENSVASGVVYLVNTKTQAVRTYIADDQGNFRFSGLDPNVDYELHAEHEDLTSATRTISNFNTSRDIEVILKLAHKKK